VRARTASGAAVDRASPVTAAWIVVDAVSA
jgi:hypothetical protein